MRLIDARVLFEDLKEYMIDSDLAISDHPDDIYHYNSGLLTAMEVVLDAPTVDEMNICKNCRWAMLAAGFEKHGHWVDTDDYDLKCSRCGKRPSYYFNEEEFDYYLCRSKYCPNCGARMDGENDEAD